MQSVPIASAANGKPQKNSKLQREFNRSHGRLSYSFLGFIFACLNPVSIPVLDGFAKEVFDCHEIKRKGTMSEKMVTCRCQHCDCHIQFDAGGFQEGDTATVKCPDCQMDTEIFIPQSTPPPPAKTVTPKPDAKTSKTTSFLETLMLPQPPGSKPDAKPSKTTSETVSTGNFWMQAFSIILFLCGALSICIGALIWFGLLTSKEGTIFQEYEGIFFGLGGLIIIALSLILWAILSLKK